MDSYSTVERYVETYCNFLVLNAICTTHTALWWAASSSSVVMPNNRRKKHKAGKQSRENRDVLRSARWAAGRDAGTGGWSEVTRKQRAAAHMRVVSVVGRRFQVEGGEWWGSAEVESLRLETIVSMM